MTTAGPNPANPAQLNALLALAQREQRAGRLAEAAQAYRQVLALRPDAAEVHNNLAVILASLGRLDQAEAHLKQALALRPDHADAHNNLAIALWKQAKTAAGAAHFRQAIALRPDFAEAHSNLGALLTREKRYDEARPSIEKALALRPDYADALNNLGNLLSEQHQFDEAAVPLQRAVALLPNCAEVHNNLGNALAGQGNFDEAQVHFERALMLTPAYAEAHTNWASLLNTQRRLEEAVVHYRQALALRPDLAEAQLGLAICQLTQGDFDHGLPAFEARLRGRDAPIFPPLPRWQGEPLSGRRLLLIAEQGFGDTIQFVRYARLLKAQGAHVILAAQRSLGRLLASYRDIDELHLLGSGGELPPADFYLPLLSAALALGTRVSTIPAETPYLFADPRLTARWREELGECDDLRIGIFWQGSPKYKADRWRSIPLSAFAPLAQLSKVRLVSLQKGFGCEQLSRVDFPVLDLSARLDEAAGPFMDTAAVIRSLDLVVTADTAIAHLAGALGTPVFLALHLSSDWRWLLKRDDSPWYPTIRLFRQTVLNGWTDVFQRIADSVRELCRQRVGAAGHLSDTAESKSSR